MSDVIVYQGEPGAYSHLACQEGFPQMTPQPCPSFAAAFAEVRSGAAKLAMIPVENTVAGRVSDIYHLLPEGGLHIIGEQYLAVHHQLLGLPGAEAKGIRSARSHPMALGQVRKRLAAMNITPVADVDTAGAARAVSALGDKSVAAIASTLAGQTYSYMVGGSFQAAQFYADVEGHPEDRAMQLALEELSFFSESVTLLGTYPAHPSRSQKG